MSSFKRCWPVLFPKSDWQTVRKLPMSSGEMSLSADMRCGEKSAGREREPAEC